MRAIQELVLLSALAMLPLLTTAVPALAVSPVAETQCQAPDSSDDDLWDYFAGYDTAGFGPGGCSNFCKAVSKVCDGNSKTRAKCIRSGDKFHHLLTRKLCDGDRECEAQAKADELLDKAEVKLRAQLAKAECKALEGDCLDDCAQGVINPQL